MVSDQEILSRVEQLLRRAPAAAANVPAVVRHLETSFGGVDLSGKASLIRDQIELLASVAAPPKDHFALHPFPPYFHQHQISPFTHLPQHHEFAFRYGARPPHVTAAMEAAAAAAAIHHHQQQLLLFGNGHEQEQQKQQLQLQIHTPEQERDQHQQQQQHQHQPQLNCVEQPQRREHDQHHQQVGVQHLEQEQEKRQPVQQQEPEKRQPVQQQEPEKRQPVQQQEPEKRQLVQQQEPAALAAAVPTTAKEGASTGVKRRGGPGGLNKVCRVTPELQTIVGEPTMARTEIVKQLWAYIRRHNLQDPNNKRKIICNDELRLVFETDCTDMFKMNKLLAKHIITLEPTKSSGPDAKKLKAVAEVISATEYESGQDLVTISGALANFFGTEETEMLEVEASRRVWDYIKANHLEDPMNPMMVLCDSKLQLLLGDESLSAFGLQDKLMRHLFKQSNKDNIN